MVKFDEEKQNEKIQSILQKEEEELAYILSQKYSLPYADLSLVSINMDALRLITEEVAKKAKMVGFALVDKKLKIGVLSPQRTEVLEELKRLEEIGYVTELFMVSNSNLEKAWLRYKDLSYATEARGGMLEVSNADIVALMEKVVSLDKLVEEVDKILAEKKSFKISRVVEVILAGALSLGASDVHLEPEDEYVQIRYRLSGVLTEVLKLDKPTYNLILSRIKLLSNLKLNMKSVAQDGRFSIKMGEAEIEIRTSTVPSGYGESIVMRVLNPESISVPMESLGMEPEFLKIIEKQITRPNGMILNTGPTGSGKTTTLYAFLRKVHTPDIKIITIEDPIEYHLQGIVQTQTDKEQGYTFAKGLRAALRQDPDIIMVGEIRDDETAEIAVNSALTGHLVFSTLHTNNAAGTFPRLINLGINPKVLISAINVAMAQRLVRKLCPECKKSVKLEGRDRELMQKISDGMSEQIRVPLKEEIFEAGIGCLKCHDGYKGRVGLYEMIIMDENIDKAIKNNPGEREIREAAKSQNIPTMQQDALIKIMRGDTSIEEVMRVIDLEEV